MRLNASSPPEFTATGYQREVNSSSKHSSYAGSPGGSGWLIIHEHTTEPAATTTWSLPSATWWACASCSSCATSKTSACTKSRGATECSHCWISPPASTSNSCAATGTGYCAGPPRSTWATLPHRCSAQAAGLSAKTLAHHPVAGIRPVAENQLHSALPAEPAPVPAKLCLA